MLLHTKHYKYDAYVSTDVLRPVQPPLVDQILQTRHETAQEHTQFITSAHCLQPWPGPVHP